MLALTKSENGYARMLASARTYPISVATPYVPCESVSIQKLLKVDLTSVDAQASQNFTYMSALVCHSQMAICRYSSLTQ